MPLFAMLGHDGPDGLARRPAVRPRHLEHLKELEREKRILFAGPLFRDDGKTPCGSLVIFDAPDLDQARAHCGNDPYVLEGVFASWECLPAAQVFPESS
ncbi:MAG: YciI family protein [bacterium]